MRKWFFYLRDSSTQLSGKAAYTYLRQISGLNRLDILNDSLHQVFMLCYINESQACSVLHTPYADYIHLCVQISVLQSPYINQIPFFILESRTVKSAVDVFTDIGIVFACLGLIIFGLAFAGCVGVLRQNIRLLR